MAKLTVFVTLANAEQSASRLSALGLAGDQAAQRIATGFSKTEQQLVRMIQQTQGYQRELDRMANAGAWSQQAGGLLLVDNAANRAAGIIKGLGDAHRGAAGHADAHSFAMGRGIRAMEGMAASAFGLNHHLTTLSVLFAEMGAGAGPVFAVISAVGILGFAWEKLSETSREQTKQLDEAKKSLKEFNEAAEAGAGGKLAVDLEIARKNAKSLNDELKATVDRTKDVTGVAGTGQAIQSEGLLALFGVKRARIGVGDQGTDAAAANQQVLQAQSNLALKFGQTTNAIILQNQKLAEQIELNREAVPLEDAHTAAMDQSQLAVELLNNKYAYQNEIVQHWTGYSKEQQAALDELAAKHRTLADAVATAAAAQKLYNDLLKYYASPEYKAIENEQRLTSINLANGQMPGARLTPGAEGMTARDLLVSSTATLKAPFVEIDTTAAKAGLAIDDLSDKIETELLGAIEKLGTKGVQSWGAFLGEIETMSLRFISEINKQLKDLDSSLTGEIDRLSKLRTLSMAVNIGATAIGGGIQAFDIGRSAGSTGAGVLGGAASGATTGAAIGSMFAPGVGTAVGAAVGAIDGAVISLFGHAQKLKDIRRDFEANEQKYIDSLTVYGSSLAQSYAGIEKAFADLEAAAKAAHTSVSADAKAAKDAAEGKLRFDFVSDLGHQLNALNGAAGEYANAIDDINKKYAENVASVYALGLGEAGLTEAQDIRRKSIEALNKALDNAASDKLLNRLFSITGGSNLGIGTALGGDPQNQFWYDSFQKYLDGLQAQKDATDAQRALDQINQGILQQQLTVAQKSLQTEQAAVDATKKVVDSLKQFQDSLKLNTSLTTLSPRGQLDEATRQFKALLAAALTGDATAAGGLPGAAQTLLGIGRSYFGSTAGYANLFKEVTTGLDTIENQFGAQLDVQTRILGESQKQVDLLQALLDATQGSDVDQLLKRMEIERQMPGGTSRADYTNDYILYSYWLTGAFKSIKDIQDQLNANRAAGRAAWNAANPPQFASGGDFAGGIMSVGERGPELVATGAARVFNARQLAAGSGDIVAELRALRREVSALRADNGSIARDLRVRAKAARNN